MDVTAPNANGVNIRNCKATGSISGADNVGGILGSENGIDQSWGATYIQNNEFTGNVSGTGTNIGPIVGFYRSINKFSFIENFQHSTVSA